jgi:hypothetical protein
MDQVRMALYDPPCGSREIHKPHDHLPSGQIMIHCDGFTAQQQGIRAMVSAAEGFYDSQIDYRAAEVVLPRNARIEMGPAVMSALQRNVRPTIDWVLTGNVHPDFPVVVVQDAGPWGWRIVIDSGEVPSDDGVG